MTFIGKMITYLGLSLLIFLPCSPATVAGLRRALPCVAGTVLARLPKNPCYNLFRVTTPPLSTTLWTGPASLITTRDQSSIFSAAAVSDIAKQAQAMFDIVTEEGHFQYEPASLTSERKQLSKLLLETIDTAAIFLASSGREQNKLSEALIFSQAQCKHFLAGHPMLQEVIEVIQEEVRPRTH